MGNELDGRYIKEAYYHSPEYGQVGILAGLFGKSDFEDCRLRFFSEYCGDHSENWVVVLKGKANVEVARYNTRFISSIQWEK